MMWFRGVFPRFRVDQLMGFAWKFLLPLALLNIFAAGIWMQLKAPINYLASAAAVFISVVILYYANKPDIPKMRVYRYAYE